jgi:hypothetical protein
MYNEQLIEEEEKPPQHSVAVTVCVASKFASDN